MAEAQLIDLNDIVVNNKVKGENFFKVFYHEGAFIGYIDDDFKYLFVFSRCFTQNLEREEVEWLKLKFELKT